MLYFILIYFINKTCNIQTDQPDKHLGHSRHHLGRLPGSNACRTSCDVLAYWTYRCCSASSLQPSSRLTCSHEDIITVGDCISVLVKFSTVLFRILLPSSRQRVARSESMTGLHRHRNSQFQANSSFQKHASLVLQEIRKQKCLVCPTLMKPTIGCMGGRDENSQMRKLHRCITSELKSHGKISRLVLI